MESSLTGSVLMSMLLTWLGFHFLLCHLGTCWGWKINSTWKVPGIVWVLSKAKPEPCSYFLYIPWHLVLSWPRRSINIVYTKLTWNILRTVSKPRFPLARKPLALEIILPLGTLLKWHPIISYAQSMCYSHHPHTLVYHPGLGVSSIWQGQQLSSFFLFVFLYYQKP